MSRRQDDKFVIFENSVWCPHAIARLRVVPSKLESWEDKSAEQRAVIEMLKTEQRRLVTENAALLKRAIDAKTAAARHQQQYARLLAQSERDRRNVALVPRP